MSWSSDKDFKLVAGAALEQESVIITDPNFFLASETSNNVIKGKMV